VSAFPIVAVAFGFALCAQAGTILAARLCATRVPFEDGPRPIAAQRWPFALAGAFLGAAAALHTTDFVQLGTLAAVALVLAACAFADLRWGIVPDAFSIPALVLVGLVALLRHDVNLLFGAAVVGLPLAAAAMLSAGRGLGWGDVKLASLGGALLGMQDAPLAVCGACVAAYAGALITRRMSRPVALAPYLAAGIAVALAIDPLH
jgi:prepilin signal peptidase PulO-like enzyme (type II secretory pathway)